MQESIDRVPDGVSIQKLDPACNHERQDLPEEKKRHQARSLRLDIRFKVSFDREDERNEFQMALIIMLPSLFCTVVIVSSPAAARGRGKKTQFGLRCCSLRCTLCWLWFKTRWAATPCDKF